VKERSPEAILQALKDGHTSISYAAEAERIDFRADATGNGDYAYGIGDAISWNQTGRIRFLIDIVGFRKGENYDVTIFRDGKSWKTMKSKEAQLRFESDVPALARSYFRVEVKGSTPEAPWLSNLAFGRFVGMTNPIYINY
jgi:hypothetical protein